MYKNAVMNMMGRIEDERKKMWKVNATENRNKVVERFN
jgi:hypothetical protein